MDAIAATEINKSEVTVAITEDNQYLVWGDATPRDVINPQISVSRIRPHVVVGSKINYSIKILFTVDNEDKTEFWLGGDRKNPVKINELERSNDIEINDAVLSNLGKKNNNWITFIKWFDNSLPVNFEGVKAFDGSTVISFVKPNDSVMYGVSEGIADRPYQQNMEYRGHDLANINPRLFASISNLPPIESFPTLNTSTRVLHDPLTPNLEFTQPLGRGEIYTGWTELDLYVLSGLENDPVRLFDMIPKVEDNLLSPDYNFSLTHENVKQYFNPFTNNRNFQETIVQRGLADFAITKYKGFLKSENFNSRFDPYAFFLSAKAHDYLAPNFTFNYSNTGYVYETYRDTRGSLFKLIDKVFSPLDQTNNGGSYPRHLIETKVYTINNKPNNYYLALGLTYNNQQQHSFFLDIDHKYFNGFNYNNSYSLNTLSFDNTTIPLAEVQFNEYSLNNLTFSGAYSYLNGQHFRFYPLGESTPDNNFFRYLDLKRISGSANILSIGQQANINYLEYKDQGTRTPLSNNKWETYNDLQARYKINIPYVYFKGEKSEIVATFNVDLKISTSQPITFYEETYKLYWNNQEIELSDLGELKQPLNINNTFIDILDIKPYYDTLVDNYIYRVIANDTLDKVLTQNVKLSVVKYKINNDGVIIKIDTKQYSALSLKKPNAEIWSASFYPQ